MNTESMVELMGQDEGAAAAGFLFFCCFTSFFMLILIVPYVLMIAGMWKTFAKAGKPGWASIVPIYNLMVLAEIGGKEPVWGLLLMIPIAGIYFGIILFYEVAIRFGKDAGFVAGLILLPFVFWPILGFGAARYRGGAPRQQAPSTSGWQPPRPRQ